MTEELPRGALPFEFHHAMSRRLVITGTGLLVAAASATTAQAQAVPVPGTSHLRFLQPPNSSKQTGYSHVVEATLPGRVIYVAGQMGLDINGNLAGAPGDFTAQATQAWENVKGALATAGAGLEHIVSIGQFMLHVRAHLPLLRDVRAKFFEPNRPPPASTLVQIGAFTREGALYEVNAVAVLPPRTG